MTSIPIYITRSRKQDLSPPHHQSFIQQSVCLCQLALYLSMLFFPSPQIISSYLSMFFSHHLFTSNGSLIFFLSQPNQRQFEIHPNKTQIIKKKNLKSKLTSLALNTQNLRTYLWVKILLKKATQELLPILPNSDEMERSRADLRK